MRNEKVAASKAKPLNNYHLSFINYHLSFVNYHLENYHLKRIPKFCNPIEKKTYLCINIRNQSVGPGINQEHSVLMAAKIKSLTGYGISLHEQQQIYSPLNFCNHEKNDINDRLSEQQTSSLRM